MNLPFHLHCLACVRRLGMESRAIQADQISASSRFSSMPPNDGRLHFEATGKHSCWGPRQELGQDEWLQIDLKTLHTITAVITQGGGVTWRYHWVTSYRVYYASSRSEKDKWLSYRNLDGSVKVNNKLKTSKQTKQKRRKQK